MKPEDLVTLIRLLDEFQENHGTTMERKSSIRMVRIAARAELSLLDVASDKGTPSDS